MSDDGTIKYTPKQNVSLLKYSTTLSDLKESLETFYDENTIANNSFRIKRVMKFYKYLSSIKNRKHPIIPVIADTRIEDDLIALKIDGKKTLGMIKNLNGSMVNVRLIESDTSFWIYSGDPIFIENEQFISANFKMEFDSAPMEFLRQCSTPEVNYIMTSQPTLRKRSRDKPRRKKRTTALTNYSTLEDQFDNSEHSLGSSKKLSRTSSHIELPDLEEINNEPFSFSLTDSDSESEDSSRQYSSDDDTVHSTSIDLPPDLTDEIINDSISNVSEQDSINFKYEFSLDPPLSPSEWKRIRTEQTLKHIEIILPVPQFQDS